MHSSLTRLAALVAAPALLGLVPAAAAAAQATLSCPATARAGQHFVTELTIDVGPTTALGAYSVTLTSDPAVVTVAAVAGGMTAAFSGTPTTDTPTPGTRNITALQSSSLDSPKGVVSVAMITFDVVASAGTTASIGLTVNHLYDTNAVPIIPATGTGCAVSVTSPTSTTARAVREEEEVPREGSRPSLRTTSAERPSYAARRSAGSGYAHARSIRVLPITPVFARARPPHRPTAPRPHSRPATRP